MQFVLADADSHIYSQRSYFIKPDPQPVLQLRTDKEKYDRREKVNLTLQFTDIGEHPLEGSFSLSVTDNTMVPRDTLSDNIVSYLLLTSDLKGHIEAPGSYSRETPEHIDLLMLTHGWTRYEIGKFLTATPSKATFKLEQRQEIRGKITNYSNKPMANASVQIFIPGENTLGEVKSNENGEFIIRDLDFPDSTIFLVRGYKEKGGKMVDITITPRLFKDPVTHFTIPRENKPLGKEEFMDQFKGSYFYQNGVKVYILDEAVVLRHRPESVQHKYEGQYTDMTDYILGQEELNKFNTSQYLSTIIPSSGCYCLRYQSDDGPQRKYASVHDRRIATDRRHAERSDAGGCGQSGSHPRRSPADFLHGPRRCRRCDCHQYQTWPFHPQSHSRVDQIHSFRLLRTG